MVKEEIVYMFKVEVIGLQLILVLILKLYQFSCFISFHPKITVQFLTPMSLLLQTPTKLFIAGQIGLIPSSLELATTFERQCAISLQHLRRILEASDRRRWSGGKGNGVCWIVSRDDEEWEKRVRGIWKAVDLADEVSLDCILFLSCLRETNVDVDSQSY